MIPRLPPHAPGMAIGLFGGSFNPAHRGHLAVSLMAMRRLGLDRVWWLVSPGNPLKDNSDLPPLRDRVAAAAAFARHPRIAVTGLEAEIGATRTFDTLTELKRRMPDVALVWIMGADNLAGFHRWGRWRDIARLAPIAVVDRPGATLAPLSPAGLRLADRRIPEARAQSLPWSQPPAWCFLHGPRSPLSSTALRRRERA